uniref:Homeodomain-like superfamily isoform 1 n=1 Tax=Tetraselmis sp. GSL018 TaxID=582737 RepID=A0A061QVU6_9CHLO
MTTRKTRTSRSTWTSSSTTGATYRACEAPVARGGLLGLWRTGWRGSTPASAIGGSCCRVCKRSPRGRRGCRPSRGRRWPSSTLSSTSTRSSSSSPTSSRCTMVDASAAQSKAKEEAGAPQLPPALIGLVVVPHAHMEAYGDSVDRGIQPWRPVCMEPPRSVMDITVLRMLDPLLRTVRNVSAQRDTERFVRHSGNRIKAGTKLLGFVPPLLQAALATYRGIFDPRLEPVQPKRKVAHSQWTPAEDELFARGIRTYGLDFVLIQKHCLPSKTVPQLRLRAKNSRRYPSNPVHKAKRDVQEPLSAEEIDAIRKALRIYGRRYNRWELISKECVPRVPPTMLPRVWAAVCSDAIGKKPSPSGRRKGVAQKRSADCRGAGGASGPAGRFWRAWRGGSVAGRWPLQNRTLPFGSGAVVTAAGDDERGAPRGHPPEAPPNPGRRGPGGRGRRHGGRGAA